MYYLKYSNAIILNITQTKFYEPRYNAAMTQKITIILLKTGARNAMIIIRAIIYNFTN